MAAREGNVDFLQGAVAAKLLTLQWIAHTHALRAAARFYIQRGNEGGKRKG